MMDEFDDSYDYELSQLDLSFIQLHESVPDPQCDASTTSDNQQALNINSNDTLSIPRTKRHHRRLILSDSEDDEDDTRPAVSCPIDSWLNPVGNQPTIIPYTEFPGLQPHFLRSQMVSSKPADFYALLVPDSVFDHIVEETNRFAEQVMAKTPNKSCRLKKWQPTNCFEMKRFFGILIWMGLVKLPQLSLYWSNTKTFEQTFIKSIMSRNRFEILLRMLHFANNDLHHDKNDRLFKIRPILEMLNEKFKFHYTPNEQLCVDESLIPFRGRVIFRQYNKQKRHKYGIKLFKLCSNPGYTVKVQVYSGKDFDNVNTTPTNVVLGLCADYLNKGHTVCTDNWYTNMDLARKLLASQTHLVGTLRRNRRGLPSPVVQVKLKVDEFSAKESEDGITVMKWRDKRDVLLLSTKHSVGFKRTTNKGKEKIKPKIVLEYNKGKSSVDLSDQMSSYTSPLRKTTKWPKRLVMELLLNTAIVNSYILFKLTTHRKLTVVQFRTQLVEYLTKAGVSTTSTVSQRPKRNKHELKKKLGLASKCRKYCTKCYQKNCEDMGRVYARNKTKRVVTYCGDCPNEPHYCIDCFNSVHRFI